MSRAKLRIISAFFLASTCLAPIHAGSGDEASAPVKISVDPVSQDVQVGGLVEINLTLKTAENNLAKAPKALDVLVEFTSPSGDTKQTNVVFQPQDTSATIKLPVDESGIFTIRAEQPELLDDDTFIFGIRPGQGAPGPGAAAPGAAETVASESSVSESAVSESAAAEPVARQPGAAVVLERRVEQPRATVTTANRGVAAAIERGAGIAPTLERASRVPQSATAEPAASSGRIQLLHRPSRPLLADGIDTGTIQAYLVGDQPVAAQDIAIHLFNSQGRLIPTPLVIQAGQLFGTTELTADQVGEVKVSFVRSEPQFNVEGPREVAFSFRPPIVGFALRPSPPSISLVERSEILLELINANNTPVKTDQERNISLYVADGHGDFEQRELTIAAGSSVARTTFLPTWWGPVTITASTPDLLSQTSSIQVTWPVLLLALSAVGGLLGGVADFAARRGRIWPIALGALTGFLLFWGAIFGLVDVLPRAVVLNPISTFAVSFLGGFAGTDVVKLLLKRFGFPA